MIKVEKKGERLWVKFFAKSWKL